jgi:nitric oxide reductase subunit B
MVPIFGVVFTTGVALLVFDLLTLGYRRRSVPNAPAVQVGTPGRWSRWMTGWETGLWLLAMWVFGGIITIGLLSFNLDTVRQGAAVLPYTMAGVGYPGLLLVTLLFVWRFLSSLEARKHVSLYPPIAGAPPAVAA